MLTWPLWAACITLLLVRGLYAAAESALHATSELRAKELAALSPRRGARLLRLKTDREPTAASLRLGMVLSGFLSASVGALVPPRLLGLSLAKLGDSPWLETLTPLSSVLLVVLLATVIEISFRAMAYARPDAWALALSGPTSLTVTFLYPLMRALVVPLNFALAPFKTKVRFEAPAPPLEELEKLLAAQAARQQVDKGAPQLIRSIFEMSDKTVRDVMVPRTEVSAIEISTPPKDILRVLAEESHSRLPVYRDDMDHVVGILHVRDLVPLMQEPVLIVLHDLLRPAVFVPWVKPIGDLLREMQKQKIHMAVVVDEYGGFMGIATLEDILREIVGDIGDEFETERTRPVEKQPDGTWLFDAMLTPQDFSRTFGFALPQGDWETVGGYLASVRGAIPEVGERFTVDGWTFVVHSKAGPRLERIRLVRPKPPAEKQNAERPREGDLVPRPSPARG